MRATPPCALISAGTRSRAMTAQAPAFSAILACSALVTSMITPPLSISAKPTLVLHSALCRADHNTVSILGSFPFLYLIGKSHFVQVSGQHTVLNKP